MTTIKCFDRELALTEALTSAPDESNILTSSTSWFSHALARNVLLPCLNKHINLKSTMYIQEISYLVLSRLRHIYLHQSSVCHSQTVALHHKQILHTIAKSNSAYLHPHVQYPPLSLAPKGKEMKGFLFILITRKRTRRPVLQVG